MRDVILIALVTVIAAFALRLSRRSRPILVFLHCAYCAVVRFVVSLISLGLALAFGWAGWKLASLFWPNPYCIAGGGVLIVAAVSIFCSALPGITPKPRSGIFGNARTAEGRDLRRSRILRSD